MADAIIIQEAKEKLMTKLKFTTVGNSVGVADPKVQKNNTTHAPVKSDAVESNEYQSEFSRQMEIAERIMHEDRDLLKILAE